MNEAILTAVLAGVGALIALWRSWVLLDRARHIEDVPTSRIRSAAQGYIELIGEAQPDQPQLRAPLTGSSCLWYDFCIERYTRTGKSHSWQTVRRGRSDHSFYLRDATGECHIHPQGADIQPLTRQRWYGHSETPMTFGGAGGSGLFTRSGRYRYTERRIHSGDPLYALGLFQTLQPLTAEQQTEQHKQELLAVWKKDHEALLQRFDRDGNGAIDPAEWEQARTEAAAVAQRYTLENFDDRQVHVLAKPPGRRQHFILACRDPRRLIRNYRLQGWALAALALVLTGACAWLLLNPSAFLSN